MGTHNDSQRLTEIETEELHANGKLFKDYKLLYRMDLGEVEYGEHHSKAATLGLASGKSRNYWLAEKGIQNPGNNGSRPYNANYKVS